MDKGYFPYGKKSKEFLLKRSLYLCDYLIKKGKKGIGVYALASGCKYGVWCGIGCG